MDHTTAPPGALPPSRWPRIAAASVRTFHAYGNWLVGITWKRFFLLSILLIIGMAILQNLPPFHWTYTETVTDSGPAAPKSPQAPAIRIDKPKADGSGESVNITIDERGVRITPRARAASAAPPAATASAAASAASGAAAEEEEPVVDIRLPPGATSDSVREAVTEARRAIREAVTEARQQTRDAAREAADDAGAGSPHRRVRVVSLGSALTDLALLWILASAVIKITYKRQIQAEAQAAQAVETAEAESLKRQVVEARMAAMQAQVEPHFLFNTLASIDHLIETDPARASRMQKNLIALLRASMPTLREADTNLGRELAVIRPYLEILKVRMEERLQTDIRVSDGLLSAEFPPMMLQSLVENAIKHGLEPKADGGTLTVAAEIVHGKLAVSVADTGLGFGKAATAGTGVGLANIRERLQLLYGNRAQLAVAENAAGGTTVTITVPYLSKPQPGDTA